MLSIINPTSTFYAVFMLSVILVLARVSYFITILIKSFKDK